jgi:hypothetical protein
MSTINTTVRDVPLMRHRDIVVDKEVLVSDNAIIATEKAAEATLRAFEASSDAFILAY